MTENSTPNNGLNVQYEKVDAAYLDNRQLKKTANTFHLWALGLEAVISGMFDGWNLGLGSGGFGGLFIATVLMTIMYVCMVYSIAELSAALPHAGLISNTPEEESALAADAEAA